MKTETLETAVHPLIHLPETLVVVRHGESTGNTMSRDERVLLPTANHAYPLTEKGKTQATSIGKELARIFPPHHFKMGFCSSMRRSQETLEYIMSEFSLTTHVVEDSRLDEKWDGIYHDLSTRDIKAKYPEQDPLYTRMGYYHFRALGGENCIDVEGRIRSFLGDLYQVEKGPAFICGHGSWMMVLRRLLEGWTIPEFIQRKTMFPPTNCAAYVYSRGGQGRYGLTVYELDDCKKDTVLA